MSRKSESIRKILAIAGVAASVAFLGVGSFTKHKVITAEAEEDLELLGFLTFEPISDLQLIIDTTFTGVVRKGDKLHSTYDRTKPRGKLACPT